MFNPQLLILMIDNVFKRWFLGWSDSKDDIFLDHLITQLMSFDTLNQFRKKL